MRYLNRINCEFNGYAGAIWQEHGLDCETAYRSERDDWILAMVASGLGFGFMPESCVNHPRVVGRPMVDPEFWREVTSSRCGAGRIRPASARWCARRCARAGSAGRRSRSRPSRRGRRGTAAQLVRSGYALPAGRRRAATGLALLGFRSRRR